MTVADCRLDLVGAPLRAAQARRLPRASPGTSGWRPRRARRSRTSSSKRCELRAGDVLLGEDRPGRAARRPTWRGRARRRGPARGPHAVERRVGECAPLRRCARDRDRRLASPGGFGRRRDTSCRDEHRSARSAPAPREGSDRRPLPRTARRAGARARRASVAGALQPRVPSRVRRDAAPVPADAPPRARSGAAAKH